MRNTKEISGVLSSCNEILHGDAFDLLCRLQPLSVNLLLTDIPYNEVNRESNGLRKLDKGNADVLDIDLASLITEMVRVTKGSGYIFCGFQQISPIVNIIKNHSEWGKCSVRLLVWEKSNPSPMNGQSIWLSSLEPIIYFKKPNGTFNEHCKGAVLRFPTERSKLHPTQKSLKLFEYIIGVSSNEGDVVCDPFMGSWTTAIAAEKMKRKWIGCDLSEDYCKIGETRLATLITKYQDRIKKLK